MQHLTYCLLGLLLTVGTVIAPGNDLNAQNPSRVFRFDYEGETVNLLTLMEASNTPAVSMAIDNGQLDSSFISKLPEAAELNTETLFPAGAASALPICIAILQLAEREELDLDAPINSYLNSGKLTGGESVTVRDVLLMKPKVGSGYKPNGYAAGAALPELTGIAEGFRFKGMRKANKSTEYGGWALLQLVLEQHYDESLNVIIQREVFRPLCLEHMFYATELNPSQRKRAAMGRIESGEAVKGGYRRYVAQSVAGLWTNAANYAKLMRELLDIKQGKEQSVLRPETVQMAFAVRYGHRSLLSHMSDDGNPYWGGNAKGYFFTMQAHFTEDWVAVAAMNRDLNWRLGSPVVWQLGKLGKQWRADARLGIILSTVEAEAALIDELEHKAFIEGVRTERLVATKGVPATITATPAFIFQSPAGRAIYGGAHNDLEAITKFIRLNQAAPKKFAADERTNILGRQRGRQTIVMPLKLTVPSGISAPSVLPASITKDLHDQLVRKTGFVQMETVGLNAQDRRLYLDVHSYRKEDGDYELTYAIFSQFNCHTPVFTNYGAPVTVSASDGDELEALSTLMAADLTKMLQPQLGFVPANLSTSIPVMGWADLGWALDKGIAGGQVTTTYSEPVAVVGTYRATLTQEDAPGLFFSFPSPLDRYSGEVRELVADFNFTAAGTMVSGQVDLPVASVSTTSGSLDTYVLKDILKSGKHPAAGLTFASVALPDTWQTNEPVEVTIPAKLTLRSKTYPIKIKAVFTPQVDGGLAIAADFGIDFRKVFGRNGPDGPEAIRHQLDFTARFLAHPLTSK